MNLPLILFTVNVIYITYDVRPYIFCLWFCFSASREAGLDSKPVTADRILDVKQNLRILNRVFDFCHFKLLKLISVIFRPKIMWLAVKDSTCCLYINSLPWREVTAAIERGERGKDYPFKIWNATVFCSKICKFWGWINKIDLVSNIMLFQCLIM